MGTFNIGTDQSITITNDQTGAAVQLDGLRDMFQMKAADTLLKSKPIDNGGVPDHRVVADGWTGTIEVERNSGTFSQLVAADEAGFFNGNPQNFYTITETIRRPDGSGTDRFQYLGCVFHQYDPGSWQKDQVTKPRIEVAAAQRIALQ